MTSPPTHGKLHNLRAFAVENGWLLLTHRLLGAAARRSRDRLLARRLGTSGLRLGRHPRLNGLTYIHLGADVSAGADLWLEAISSLAGQTFAPEIRIGDGCSFSERVHIAATHSVILGHGVLVGSNVLITDHAHGTYSGAAPHTGPDIPPNRRPLSSNRSVVIDDNVWIGDNVAVLGGSEIGRGSVIGANSVVNGVVPPCTIAVGAPARPVRQWDPASGRWVAL